ncbi:MAG: hypothetical protein Q8O04_07960 [Deltaproteobacteria bacterium]|nr:hypothetical protein [Deltaproteobacteria bacterium]
MTAGKTQRAFESVGLPRKIPYDAVVIMGVVDDHGSILPGWDYPFSIAEEKAVSKLKDRGYKRIGVFREPDFKLLRRILAGKSMKAVVFLGHGEFHGKSYSFNLNPKANLSSDDLHDWAMEDVVKPHLSKEAIARLNSNPMIEDAVRRASSYNFDLAVVHSCHSLRDPELRTALGGEFQGNPWYSLINLPPLSPHAQHTLRVGSEAFSKDPVGALQGALVQALKRLDQAGASLVQPGYRSALRAALSDLIAARRQGANVQTKVLDSLRKQFSVEFSPDQGEYEDLSLDEAVELLDEDRHIHEEEVLDCGVPTKSSNGELGCRHRVKGGGPCWQHEECLEPPEEDEESGEEVE